MSEHAVPDGLPKLVSTDHDPHPPLNFTYRTHRLDPSSADLPFLAGKFSALSLRALTADPTSFGMAYATEAAFTPADWIQRITRPNVHIFICVAHPTPAEAEEKAEQVPTTTSQSLHASLPSSREFSLLHGHWAGMVTQLQWPKSIYHLPLSGAPEPLDDEVETKWHQTATWVDALHRGTGVATQLIETAVAFAANAKSGTGGKGEGKVKQARIRAFTGPQNRSSLTLYGKCGFPVVGKVTVEEAIVANGNAEFGFLGRTDWPEEMMKYRGGWVMERVQPVEGEVNEKE